MTIRPRLTAIAILAAALGTACAGDDDSDPNGGVTSETPPTSSNEVKVEGLWRVASVCIDGFRVFIADHQQVGYGVTAVADPTCREAGTR